MALAWGFLGAQFSLTGVLRASGNMVSTMVLTLISQWVLQFPLAYVLSKHTAMGERGIWWAFPVTNVIIVLVTLGVYAQGDWKRKRLVDPESVRAAWCRARSSPTRERGSRKRDRHPRAKRKGHCRKQESATLFVR